MQPEIALCSPLAANCLKPISLEDDSKTLMMVTPDVKPKPLRLAKAILFVAMLQAAAGAVTFILALYAIDAWSSAKVNSKNGFFIVADVGAILGTSASFLAGLLVCLAWKQLAGRPDHSGGNRLEVSKFAKWSRLVSVAAVLSLCFPLTGYMVWLWLAPNVDSSGLYLFRHDRGYFIQLELGRAGAKFVILMTMLLLNGLLSALMIMLIRWSRATRIVKALSTAAYFVVAVDKPAERMQTSVSSSTEIGQDDRCAA